ncbi:hypothetical protein B5M09_006682 [Aphanomyces astaci]|uniref:ABC transporter domain-containing protein n=1 Tax=Aphanomyces astaci TaxID=112090 RepID=A0A3R7WIY8_APHAT|nr:hypothetical protein B5M09_006682 [Aphanomyces astaci]
MDLLCGIHGQFVPGTMTALMGTSGAGKSTLLDVLAGRKNSGKIKGLMDMNGNALMRSVQKQFGYVEQFDLHCLTATVQEALEFSASLRLPASEDVTRIIQATLDILELHGDRGKRISDLSNEQFKRVTIGVELVANPSILFLDEPTSGLDVHAAKVVLDAILRIARSGRTVICTIHQPSFVLFAMFDALVLLRTGGNMVYVGPLNGGNAIVEYFEAIPGIRKCRDRENPASYMLDVMAANPRTDFSSIYKASALYTDNERTIAAASAPTQLRMPTRRRQSNYATQLYYLGLRTTRKYWRTREYSLGRVLITVFVAGIFGVLYRRGDGLQYTTQLQSQALLVFVGPLFMGIISVITVNESLGLPVVDAERMVFFRERASGMYATLPYAIVFALVEVPYVVMNSLVFSGLFYILVGLKATADAFTWFCAYYFLYNLFATYLGQLLVVILPDLRTAVMATGGLNSLMSLFAGFFIHKDNIPAAWSFMYWMSPLHYVLEGMMCTQYADNHASIALSSKGTILSRENTTVSAYVFEMFGGGLSADNNVPNVGFLGLCIAVVKIGTFLAMKFVSASARGRHFITMADSDNESYDSSSPRSSSYDDWTKEPLVGEKLCVYLLHWDKATQDLPDIFDTTLIKPKDPTTIYRCVSECVIHYHSTTLTRAQFELEYGMPPRSRDEEIMRLRHAMLAQYLTEVEMDRKK